jgi:hypothetical protein
MIIRAKTLSRKELRGTNFMLASPFEFNPYHVSLPWISECSLCVFAPLHEICFRELTRHV